MEGSHNHNQPNPRFGFVQNPGGLHYGTGLDTGQNLSTPGQNLSTPGQSLPPPPPLVRHGHPSSAATTSPSDSFNAALEDHFRRSLNPYSSTNISSRNGISVPSSMGSSVGSSMGNSMGTSMMNNMGTSIGSSMGNTLGTNIGSSMGSNMGTSMMNNMGTSVGSSMGNTMGTSIGSSMGSSSVPNQANTRFGFPNPTHTGAQQYGPNWRGPNMRHPGTMTRVPGDPTLRQALGHEYNIARMQQDKQTTFAVNQGQGHFAGAAGQGYVYGSLTNDVNDSNNFRMDSRYASSCRMPNNITQNVPANGRQAGQHFAPSFNTFGEMQRTQGYGSNANQYSINQGLSIPPPAHQNGPRMPPPAHQQQSGTITPGHIGVNSRQTQVSSGYGMVPAAQSHYGGLSMQGHISQGQGHIGMSAGQGFIPQGQNVYGVNQIQRGQDGLVQGQGHFQIQDQQRSNTFSGGQGNPASNKERFVNVVEAAASLSRLSNSGDSESKLRLLHLKDKLVKSGLLGADESLPSFLAKYAIREKNRLFSQQQQAHARNQNIAAQTPASETVTAPAQPVKAQDHASAIQSAFVIPQSHEAQDKAVLGRWYAPPSAQTGMPGQALGPAGSQSTGQSGTVTKTAPTATVTAYPTSGANQAAGEPFVLKPTVCNEEVIEYKVADLLRCLPQSVRSRHINSVNSDKSSGQSVLGTKQTLDQVNPGTVSDKSQQREEPTSPIHMPKPPADTVEKETNSSGPSAETVEKETRTSGLPAETVEKETSKTGSREGTPGSDEQFLGMNSLDLNKQKLFDELVLNSQFGTQDLNPEIDYRTYLPSPGLPADFDTTPSPVIRETESPFVSRTDSQTDTETNFVARKSPELPAPSQKESGINTVQDRGEKESSVETEILSEPAVEIDRDESPVLISKKRKLSSVSDSNLGRITPPVKRYRGRGRGRGRGTRAKGKGRAWAVNLTPSNRQNKPVRGARKQTARSSRGKGRGAKAKSASGAEVDDSPLAKTEKSPERSESPSVAGLDGQVLQKPQDLKNLMDNLPNEELEKTTVSLSTLKMMLAWSQAKENAGLEEEDQDSDTISVISTGDTENQVEEMETQDVSSEINNKEHNIYEPPVEGIDGNSRERTEEESENKDTDIPEIEKQDVEVTSPVKEVVEEFKDAPNVTGTSENEKEEENEKNEDQTKDSIDDIRSEERNESGDQITVADVESENKEEPSTSSDVQVEKNNSKPSDVETQVYSVTDTHKMTWVRYHGKTVTRLITPGGNFFIMKEILRRCFRIQEPNKSLKFSKIGILKRKVLKIPDTELEPLFYDYVVKNLVDRKVIRTIPDKFIIISEEDANRLFHYVCKDQYCGSACVTPFIQNRASSVLKKSETNSSEVSDTSQAKTVVKKDRNLFDFLESEAVSPKVEIISPRKKRQKHPSSEVINLCSDEEGSNGYDSDKTLPYVDGKPVSLDKLKEMEEIAAKSVTENDIGEKEIKSSTKKISSDSNADTEIVLEKETEETKERKVSKSKSKSDKTVTFETQDSDTGTNTLNTCNSGQESVHTTDLTNVSETIDKGEHAAEKSLIEDHSQNLNTNCDEAGEGKLSGKVINDSHKSNTKESEKNKVSDNEVIVIDDDEEDNSFSETMATEIGVCKLTLDKMKKEIGLGSNTNVGQKEPVELVQVHNIDSTAICADNYDRSHARESNKQKLKLGAVEEERVGIAGISGITDKCLRVNDNALDRSVDKCMDIDLTLEDDRHDVTIGEWVFPAPPKTYPQEGTKKIEEAHETLDRIIERANNAKKTEDFVDVLDTVFKLTEPLKQWTNTLLDHYEEGLIIEAQRLKSLDQLKLNDISNTIDIDDDDVEMDTSRGNDST